MKLSDYARKIGVTYKTAYRMFKRGELAGYQLPTGTIILNDDMAVAAAPVATEAALYARVSSHDQKADVERQLGRLRDYAAARGYRVTREVVEIASGLNDRRPKFSQLLSDKAIGTILVEHEERATRFGFNYLALLLEGQGRRIEVANEVESKDELVDDFVSLITAMAARIYGRRSSRRRAEQVRRCVEDAYSASVQDGTEAE